MELLKIDRNNPDSTIIQKAAKVLEKGGIIVYPTDTAYGIGVNALNEVAIRKLYEIKGRDFSKPTHIVVHDWEMIEELCVVNKQAKKLYDAFLPGPLTLILPKKDSVPSILVANGSTLGVRVPNSPITLSLSQFSTSPYTTPSANRSGEPTPYSIEEVKKVLDIEKVDLVLDAGELPRTLPSTVIDISKNELKIIREGPITKVEIDNRSKRFLQNDY